MSWFSQAKLLKNVKAVKGWELLLQNKLSCCGKGELFGVAPGPQQTDSFGVFGVGVNPVVTGFVDHGSEEKGGFAATGKMVALAVVDGLSAVRTNGTNRYFLPGFPVGHEEGFSCVAKQWDLAPFCDRLIALIGRRVGRLG